MKVLCAFPEEFVSLFTYTGLQPSDVIDAVYIHEDVTLQRGDHVVLSFLNSYIRECGEDGKIILSLTYLYRTLLHVWIPYMYP